MRIPSNAVIAGLVAAALCCAVAPAGELDDAVRSGDVPKIRALLQSGVDLEAPARDSLTPLLWAVQADDSELARLLLEAGASPDTPNRYGITPLWLAATNASPELVELLLAQGADAALALPHGETPLMAAARSGDADSIALLIDAGADPDAAETSLGETALMWAAGENHAAAVRALVSGGADPDIASRALELAPMNWVQVGMVSTVLPVGGWAALLYAARENAQAAARALIEAGADPDLQDPEGNTALLIALANDHFDMAAVLLEAGADPNVADRAGMGALFAAVDRVGAAPDFGRPPVARLDVRDAGDLVRLSLTHGADPNAQLTGATLARHHGFPDRSIGAGGTALMRAAREGDLDSVHALLGAGAAVDLTRDDGANVLHVLAGGRQPRDEEEAQVQRTVFAALLEAGADPVAAADNGDTPVHSAARSGNTAMIELLGEHGAPLDAENAEGQRPIDIVTAPGRFHNEAVAALLDSLTGASRPAPSAP